MNAYRIKSMGTELHGNEYPGRGIVIGLTEDGTRAAAAYFICGRSKNSRNRIFVRDGKGLKILPFDESKLSDPSLIIYSPLAVLGDNERIIITNGDQTDTIRDFLEKGGSFEEALRTRRFEPDAPNFTPRISGLIDRSGDGFSYKLSILKSGDGEGSVCSRCTFEYEPKRGLGHFIRTYECDGEPLPSFSGEPLRVYIPNDIDEFYEDIWNNLDANNRISLYVRYTELSTGKCEDRLMNGLEGRKL